MFKLTTPPRFKRDMKICQKRHKDMALLTQVLTLLRMAEDLPPKYRDHTMVGDYIGYRECHIEPDWLLIYRYQGDEIILYRTGTHSDLFR